MAVPDSIIASMIKFTNVVKDFRRARVLDGINLDIGIGERVALIGSNGAGKTTLIRCLLGEYTYGGEVAINGLDPRSNRTQVLGNIGFVPQLPPPLKMPVGQLIDFSASLCGTDPLRIHAIAKRLGLAIEEILSRQFVRLSGGMKQKLLIAIALGREAKVLVMDEPAANLDPWRTKKAMSRGNSGKTRRAGSRDITMAEPIAPTYCGCWSESTAASRVG